MEARKKAIEDGEEDLAIVFFIAATRYLLGRNAWSE